MAIGEALCGVYGGVWLGMCVCVGTGGGGALRDAR